jgi:hypothetical protein
MFHDLPRVLLSARLFLGQASVARADNLEALAHFSQSGAIREFLRTAREEGCGGLMTLGDERVVRALKLMRSSDPSGFQVLPIIPNVPGYVREATEYGLPGAGLRRLTRAGPGAFLRAALTGLLRAPRVLRRDFAALLAVLCEIEMGEFHQFGPPAVFLHHQMTDMALCFGRRALFEEFCGAMRSRFKTEPGLVTSNFALLARRLTEWDIDVSLIAAPLNRENFLMPGGLDAYRACLAPGRFRLVADRIAAESPSPRNAVDWAASQKGVEAVVVEKVLEPGLLRPRREMGAENSEGREG